MIKNRREYRATKSAIEKFESALSELESAPEGHIHPVLHEAQAAALRSQRDELREQIAEYEGLLSGESTILSDSFDELPTALIRARIAAGLTQKDLADRLGMREQQIQRYEATAYASASFTRLRQVVSALGLAAKEEFYLPRPARTISEKLTTAGFDPTFVRRRLLPTTQGGVEAGSETWLAAAVSRSFGWSMATLFGSKPLDLGGDVLVDARFKMSMNTEERWSRVYAAYSRHLCVALLACSTSTQPEIKTDPKLVRSEVLESHGDLSFRSLLRYVWDVGVPVLPLSDRAAFHGACWRVDGRNAIVLKQRKMSASLWSFDLLHELSHAGQRPKDRESASLEFREIGQGEGGSDEEDAANEFASKVMLGEDPDALVQKAMEKASFDLGTLKRAVTTVALEESVPVDALANRVAFHLSTRYGENWWGAATNLQKREEDPLTIARDELRERTRFDLLDDLDRELLELALA